MNENTKTEIENEIQANDIVLYMKGTPVFPQCGFQLQPLVYLIT